MGYKSGHLRRDRKEEKIARKKWGEIQLKGSQKRGIHGEVQGAVSLMPKSGKIWKVQLTVTGGFRVGQD